MLNLVYLEDFQHTRKGEYRVREKLEQPNLLFDTRYIKFLAKAHPHLCIGTTDVGTPYYVSTISCLDMLSPGLLSRTIRNNFFIPSLLISPRTLVFGLPFEPYQQTSTLEALPDVKTMHIMAKSLRADVILMTNLDPGSTRFRHFQEQGFFSIPSFPDMTLSIHGNSFEDFLHRLTQKHRYSIRQHMRRFSSKGHKVEKVATVSFELARDCYDAYVGFYDRAKVPWFKYEFDYFHGFLRHVPHGFVKVARTFHGQFIGMVLGMREGRYMHITRLGVHPDYVRKDSVLFRLFYAAIEESIATSCEMISLGPTSYRIKRRMGACMKRVKNLISPVSSSWQLLMACNPSFFLLRHLTDDTVMEEFY